MNTSKTAKKGETGKKEKTAKPRERTTAPPPPRKFAHSSKEAVRDYIRRLQGPPKDAETAFRELWEVPKAYIPDLIQEVENPSKSMVREVLILVFDREGFVSRDAKLSELVRRTRTDPKAWQSLMSARAGVYEYRVPGLGEIAYDQIGIGNARGGRAFKVRLRNLRGFRVGEVIRVALLNRFRSPRHPRGDGTGNLRGWWQAYYEMMKREL